MNEIAIIGGGAAGMMAGIRLADKGYKPTIYEKNEKLGKKLFITGKGRCNLANNCEVDALLKNVVSNPKFMYSAFYGFDAAAAMKFFEDQGLCLKTERGGRVFPASDHSSDVIASLRGALQKRNVCVKLNTEVKDILYEDCHEGDHEKRVTGIVIDERGSIKSIPYDDVVVATGGISYASTGSTGAGYDFARTLGISVNEPRPSLVPLTIKEDFCAKLMGLSLKNVSVSIVTEVKNKKKKIYEGFGEMLFTHFGVSGPLILSASAYIGRYAGSDLKLSIDLKPALSEEQLDERILRDFKTNINRQFRNSLNELLPKKLIPVVIAGSGIDENKRVNEITKEERQKLVATLKQFELSITGTRGFDEAIITQGGVSVKEINPKDMSAKKVAGLRFCGEVIDVDALTGGFNLQIAWSTAAALE